MSRGRMIGVLCLLGYCSGAVGAAPLALPISQSSIVLTPESPRVLSPDHALYHQVTIEPVAGMPSAVMTSGQLKVTSEQEFNGALQQAFADAGMTAPAGAAPRFRLAVSYLDISAPAALSISKPATARFHYDLRRVDTGQLLFSRAIQTQSDFHGGDRSERAVAAVRTAILANVASAVLCLDKAAYGRAPSDCALTPTAGLTVPGTRYLRDQPAVRKAFEALNELHERFAKDCPSGAHASLRGPRLNVQERASYVCRDERDQVVPWAKSDAPEAGPRAVAPTGLAEPPKEGAREVSLVVRIDVSAEGAPTACNVVSSSGYPAFDAKFCKDVVSTFRYEPARTNGVAHAASVDQKFRLVLPDR